MINSNLISLRLRRCAIYFNVQVSRISHYGLYELSNRLIIKAFAALLSILFLPLSIILFFLDFRRIMLFTDRIGHLAIEPDILLKAQHLGLIKTKRWFVLAPPKRVANLYLLKYWQRYFSIYQGTLSCFFLHCISLWPFMRYDLSHFINNDNDAQLGYKVYQLWSDKPPLLSLSAEDMEWGNDQLTRLNLPHDAWFVCIHAREGGFSPVDEVLHAHRNGKIENLIPAIEEITQRGGWVVRLGDPTMVPLKKMPRVIDYAHHPLRSARLDIILCARSRFILGNTSGMFLIGTIFGVPSALANMIPMPTLGFSPKDLSMPKSYFSNKEARYLSFPEVMDSQISIFRYASLYDQANVTVKENDADDILLLTKEMLDRLDGKFIETTDDLALHENYMSLFKSHHYSYGAISKTSFNFLRKHQNLLKT